MLVVLYEVLEIMQAAGQVNYEADLTVLCDMQVNNFRLCPGIVIEILGCFTMPGLELV
jgi:hypothetical protein